MNERPGPWTSVTPAWGAEVMATGIVSVGLHLAGIEWLSRCLLVVAALMWVALAAVFLARLVRDQSRWVSEADAPGSLTAVAGTGVLGVRLAQLGWLPLASAALVLAAVLWLLLLPRVIGHLRRRVPGVAYLVCVSTQSLVVLATTLTPATHTEFLLWPAAILFVLGLCLYVLVLTHFDFGQLRSGTGDHWVAGGAIAISALAASKLVAATTDAHTALRALTLLLLAIALGWYLVLAFCEARWPRPSYDVRRWSTVFPLGMTSVACLSGGAALKVGALTVLGDILLLPAVIVWVAVAVGAVREARRAHVSGG